MLLAVHCRGTVELSLLSAAVAEKVATFVLRRT